MLRRQRRAEAFPHPAAVFLPHPSQHLATELLRVGPARPPPRASVFQSGRPFLLVSFPHPLRLPVAQPDHRCRVYHSQVLTLHPRQYPCPCQLPLAHLRSPQLDLLLEILLGDISIEDKRGHYHRGTTVEPASGGSVICETPPA